MLNSVSPPNGRVVCFDKYLWSVLLTGGLPWIKRDLLDFQSLSQTSPQMFYRDAAYAMLVLHASTRSICPFIALSSYFVSYRSQAAALKLLTRLRLSPSAKKSSQTVTLRQFIMRILIHNLWPWERVQMRREWDWFSLTDGNKDELMPSVILHISPFIIMGHVLSHCRLISATFKAKEALFHRLKVLM